MEKNKQSLVLPNTLELSEWIKISLNSNNDILRQIALEEMIGNEISSGFSEILTNISTNDSSQICRSKALWLLNLDETKHSLKASLKQLKVTPDFVSFQFKKGDYAKINLFKNMLEKAPQADIIELWRKTLNTTNETNILLVGLDILGKFGDEEDTIYAIKQLRNQDPEVVCAALSLLDNQDQDLLKKYIKIGLVSKNANLVLHSIDLLSQIDEAESIKYLSLLLLNKDSLVRQKALRELLLIDFEKIEDLYWKYIGIEDNPLLLAKAGQLAILNPKQHYPFKIYDIMLSAPELKQHILQLILKGTIEKAISSGILEGKDTNIYLNEIKKYMANKKSEQAIRFFISNLKSTDVAIRANAVEKLSKFVAHPQIKALLEEQYKNETDPNIKSDLATIFEDEIDNNVSSKIEAPTFSESQQEATNSNSYNETAKEQDSSEELPLLHMGESTSSDNTEFNNEKQAEPSEPSDSQKEEEEEEEEENTEFLTSFPDTTEFIKLTTKEQRVLIQKIKHIEDYPICKKTLLEAINCGIKKTVLLDILEAIGKYGNSNDIKFIYHLTKSEDSSIVAQTIKSVGAIDLDKILPDLNSFLNNDDSRIQSAAFEVLIIADKQEAIKYVGNMLKSDQDPIRHMGLSLISQIDYPSAEPLLYWMLDHETNIELQNQVCYIVSANPTKEGINKLFAFTHDKNGDIKEGMAEIWTSAVLSAQNIFNQTKEEIESECWNNLVRTEQEAKKEEADYKFNSIVENQNYVSAEFDSSLGRITEPDNSNTLEKIFVHVYQFKYHYGVAIIILGIFTYIMSSDRPVKNVYHKSKKSNVSESNFIQDEMPVPSTQVGSEDWVGGIKSGARKILTSSGYANVIRSATHEQEAFREEAKKKEKEYFENMMNDPNASQEDKDWAQTKLDDNFQTGMKAFENRNYDDAKFYLEKVANDPKMNTYGKIEAMQKLIEITDIEQDKDAWVKWMDRMFKEAKKLEYFSHVNAFDNFADTLKRIEEAKNLLKNDSEARSTAIKAYKEQFNYSDKEARKAVEDIMYFKHPFGY